MELHNVQGYHEILALGKIVAIHYKILKNAMVCPNGFNI